MLIDLLADKHRLDGFVNFLTQIIELCSYNISRGLAPVVQKVDNAIHRINHYPLDIAIGFVITYPVDSDLSGG